MKILSIIFIVALFVSCTKKPENIGIESKENSNSTETDEKIGSDNLEETYKDDVTVFTKQQYILNYPDTTDIQNANDNDTNIEIIGWTRNGLLAYREYYYESGRPGDAYYFRILNTINDEYVINDFAPLMSGEVGGGVITMENKLVTYDSVNDLRQRWNNLLREYGFNNEIEEPIAAINQTTYDRFPYNNFECWFNYSLTGLFHYGDIHWELIVTNGKSQKTVTREQTYRSGITGSKIMGYLKSPYENRIAIIVTSHVPSGITIPYFYTKIYGCNMDAGFDQ